VKDVHLCKFTLFIQVIDAYDQHCSYLKLSTYLVSYLGIFHSFIKVSRISCTGNQFKLQNAVPYWCGSLQRCTFPSFMDVLLPLRLLLNESLVERILATGRVVIWAGLETVWLLLVMVYFGILYGCPSSSVLISEGNQPWLKRS